MRERGIIFNSEMVKAILDGRKTQTRRIVKLPIIDRDAMCELSGNEIAGEINGGNFRNSQIGQPGDRLWVRETYRVHSRATDVATLVYKASERQSWTQQTHRVPISECNKPVSAEKWTPSIHMPRWASRITLEITGVRVERLQQVTDVEAMREGIQNLTTLSHADFGIPGLVNAQHPVRAFQLLWESIYGADNWQANPWVWVIEFKRIEGEQP
ncbi:hypothetical protein [Erwinia sp. SLM-02]|uniref:hypothetical protein n=1 Tax=Erwinia sp. SLM-02 TaxID=3020057 RepID=UPI0030807EAD